MLKRVQDLIPGDILVWQEKTHTHDIVLSIQKLYTFNSVYYDVIVLFKYKYQELITYNFLENRLLFVI